ncbi:Gfo/Idh/MocA family oxidoreductase [Saccharopolyspora sp. TS4A08]|uniref:Gfo/Idh/MocA family oxidoreductase n=1 Tax=Saccharopolyspora ipomoeae TaxID=3042027 RepID=A0ABT6PGR7_9PSEU|nr:Gfo/Idh/MocA family oxidoreductase [Saccharopolyspora sp. TS4A08]MDI2027045.1 Gfo/Idh/MocA family oxidoreductase [Saccharopolyspora sp. TS4A08]
MRRVGVVGLGAISAYYLAAVEARGWELAAVCDLRPDRLRGFAPHVGCFTDHRALLGSVELDGLIVTAPNDAHAAVCRDALRRGVPVCVEKPLAVSLDDARELVAIATRSGVPLLTSFHRRYNDNVRRLLTEVTARGGATALRVRYLERIEEHLGGDTWYLDPVRCGGGCVADNGPNAFDLVRLFLGDVDLVHAVVKEEGGTDRQAVIELESASGVPAVVELDWSHPGETKDVEMLLADGTRLRADMLAGHPGFKNSLWHEYHGVLDEFETAGTDPGGLAALRLVHDTYRFCQEGTR